MSQNRNSTPEHWLRYWKRCLEDSVLADIELGSFQKKDRKGVSRDFVFIDNFSPDAESVPDSTLRDCQEILERLNPKVSSAETDVLISPFLFQKNKSEKDAFSPFWYRAHIDYDGKLSLPDNVMPIVPRKYMSPYIENANDENLIFGDVDDVSRKLFFFQDAEFEKYSDYIKELELAFRGITEDNKGFAEYEKACKFDQMDGFEAFFHFIERRTGVIVFLSDNNGALNPTKSILNLYEDLCSGSDYPELLSRMILGNTRLTPFLPEDKWPEISRSHLGQMNGDFSLSYSQRRSLYTILSQWDSTPVHAVTGPPGTGKTTLLQSIVADLVVKSVFKDEPCIIWGSAATNQAVTNIIDSFSKVGGNSRWLPLNEFFHGGYGTFFPSSKYDKEQLKDKNYVSFDLKNKNRRERGTFVNIESKEYLDEAKRFYLEKAGKSLGFSENCGIEDIIKLLKDKLKSYKKILENYTSSTYSLIAALSEFPQYVHNEKLLIDDVNNDFLNYKKQCSSIEDEIDCLREKIDTLSNTIKVREKVKKAIADLDEIVNVFIRGRECLNDYNVPFLFRFLFGDRIQKKKDKLKVRYQYVIEKIQGILSGLQEKRIYLDSLLNQLYLLNYELSCKKEKLVLVESRWAALIVLSRIIEKRKFWEQSLLKEYEMEDTSLPLLDKYVLYDKLDGFRAKMFNLAIHYWEGRWLLEVEKLVNSNENVVCEIDSASGRLRYYKDDEDSVKCCLKRYAMLTPCFVSTFHSAPGRLCYYDPAVKKKQYLKDFVDCLIIDEAGQASPEVGMAIFSLAKKAVVVGDTKQIEPVWNILPPADLANLGRYGLTNDDSDYMNARRCSCGSIMKVAQTACSVKDDSIDEKGNILLEHRRCLPEIIRYCSELAYNNQIIAKREAEPTIFPQMAFVNVPCNLSTKNGNKRENPEESKAICEWLLENREKIEIEYNKTNPEQPRKLGELVGILTPFCGQKERIRKDMTDYGFDSNDFKMGTVHALQGAERPIILFSSVYTKTDDVKDMFFDKNVNLLNVAVSRAKDSFILFGDERIFTNVDTPSGKLFNVVKRNCL